MQRGAFPIDARLLLAAIGGRWILDLQTALGQAEVLQLTVQRADRALLERRDRLALAHLLVVQRGKRVPGLRFTAGEHLITATQLRHGAVEVAPLVALEERR